MLTILVPCAGEGRRFREAGFTDPKPLIPCRGVPMLRRVIDNVRPAGECHFVFVVRHDDGVQRFLQEWWDGKTEWNVVGIDEKTGGAACTCLVAKDDIDPKEPLLIANCDQLVEGGIATLLEADADAAVLTFRGDDDPKWSYARVESGYDLSYQVKPVVREVIEKPLFPETTRLFRATTGHYYFRRAGDFFAAAECMIALGDRTGGEFYVAPTLNYLIAAHKKVVEVRVEDFGGKFVGLGTPEDVAEYEKGA